MFLHFFATIGALCGIACLTAAALSRNDIRRRGWLTASMAWLVYLGIMALLLTVMP